MTNVISLAGQLTALRASEVTVNDAGFTPFGDPWIDIAETDLFEAFNTHQYLKVKPRKAFKNRYQFDAVANQGDLLERALIAQLRVILAGNQALLHADFFDIDGTDLFTESKAWRRNEAWARALTIALLEQLEWPVHSADDIDQAVWALSREVIGDNWSSVCMHIAVLSSGRYFKAPYQAPRHPSPITQEIFDRVFRDIEGAPMTGLRSESTSLEESIAF